MRGLAITLSIALCGLLVPSRAVWADAAGQLRLGAEALERGDLEAAERFYRRAYEGERLTGEERRQALDGLLQAATRRDRLGELAAYLEKHFDSVPEEQHGPLFAALARCLKARDGHLHGALGLLQRAAESAKGSRAAVLVLRGELQRLASTPARAIEQDLRQIQSLSAHVPRSLPKPGRSPEPLATKLPELAAPARPQYGLQTARLTKPAPARALAGMLPVQLRAPQAPRVRGAAPSSVTKPAPGPRTPAPALAAAFFSQVYQKASELGAQGFFDNAKAEYATLMQLFPDTPQAQQAARYALQLFRQQQGAGQQGAALVAYVRWILAISGPKGSDYPEHLAFTTLAEGVDPLVLTREAEAFIKRHPDSKWLPGVQLQLAVALDSIGDSKRAIQVLEPLAKPPLDSALRAKAAHILAWLCVFHGDAAHANQTLQALAAQTESPDRADKARRLLEQMAAHPLPKLAIVDLKAADDPGEAVASRLLAVADGLLRKGEPERAMDLYALYLRIADDSPGYWAARTRIERFKQTGQVDPE